MPILHQNSQTSRAIGADNSIFFAFQFYTQTTKKYYYFYACIDIPLAEVDNYTTSKDSKISYVERKAKG